MKHVIARRMAVIICILCFNTAWAGAQASVEGHINGPNNDPVAGADVTLKAVRGRLTQTTKSDAQGVFRFPSVEAGDFEVRVEADGFFAAESHFAAAPRQSVTLTIQMAPRQARAEEITVHSSASEAAVDQTGTSHLMTHMQLEELPAPVTRDIPTMAQNLIPGATLSHDNFVHVRGNELSLHEFINGVSFLDNAHQHFTPGITPEIFESVNMITGGFPAEFGNRFGGILDITTRTGKSMDGHGTLTIGGGTVLNNDASIDYGGSKGKWGYYGLFGGYTSDRFLNPAQPDELHDFGYGLRGAGQLDYQGDKNLIKALFTTGQTRFQLPNTDEQDALGRNANRYLDSQTGIVSWQHIFSPALLISNSVYERTVADVVHGTNDPVTQYSAANRDTLTLGFKSDLSYSVKKHNLKLGIDLSRLQLREFFDFDPQMEDPDPEEFSFRGRIHGGQISLYGQDHFNVTPNFTLDYGVRWDRFDLIGLYQELSPRFGAAYRFRKTGTTLHAAYNRFFSPPPLEYALLGSFVGNIPLDPGRETGNVLPFRQNFYEAGINQQLGSHFMLDVNGYLHRGNDSFENSEISNTRVFVPTNFSREHSQGLEVTLTMKQWESTGLSGRLSYSVSRTNIFGPITGGLADEVLPPGFETHPAYDQRHAGVGSLYYRSKRHGFWSGANLQYGSGTFSEDGYLPQHLTADLAAGATLWRNPQEKQTLDLEFNIINVGDTRYQIAKESELTPIQYSARRVVAGRLKLHF